MQNKSFQLSQPFCLTNISKSSSSKRKLIFVVSFKFI